MLSADYATLLLMLCRRYFHAADMLRADAAASADTTLRHDAAIDTLSLILLRCFSMLLILLLCWRC